MPERTARPPGAREFVVLGEGVATPRARPPRGSLRQDGPQLVGQERPDYAHYRRGEAAAVASGVADAIGRLPGAFADFARDYAAAFA